MTGLNVDAIIHALREVLPADRETFGLHEPCFAGSERDYVKDCLDTGWVSSVGSYVDRFEKMLGDYTGSRYAVAVVNGTAALHICLILAGVRQGDEVLVPAMTFVATANAVSYCGAVPHFVDSEEKTLGLDPEKLNFYLEEIAELRDGTCFNRLTGRPIRAAVPMHAFGHPVAMDPLIEVCERWRLVLIEDAAESLGSFYKGRHTGTFGTISALSFNGNKIITCGGGGALLTNDEEFGKRAKHLTTTAKVPHPWVFYHDTTGFNYRMPNINAALGCAQLEQISGFISRKRALAVKYSEAFKSVQGVRFVKEPSFATSNYWLNSLLVNREHECMRDLILDTANSKGIFVRPSWTLMHRLPMYKDCPRMDLSMAEEFERRLINIPSSAFLGAEK